MPRVIVIAAVLLTAHVAAARGITSKELMGTWIMGAAGADSLRHVPIRFHLQHYT